jgi:hypothetical protein
MCGCVRAAATSAATAFPATHTYPPHSDEQLPMYGNLVYEAPRLQPQDLDEYYKDASFGVKAEDVERTYSPRADVTIVRDKQFGVPRICGNDLRNAQIYLSMVARFGRKRGPRLYRRLRSAEDPETPVTTEPQEGLQVRGAPAEDRQGQLDRPADVPAGRRGPGARRALGIRIHR